MTTAAARVKRYGCQSQKAHAHETKLDLVIDLGAQYEDE